jgi:hypothetical protein
MTIYQEGAMAILRKFLVMLIAALKEWLLALLVRLGWRLLTALAMIIVPLLITVLYYATISLVGAFVLLLLFIGIGWLVWRALRQHWRNQEQT